MLSMNARDLNSPEYAPRVGERTRELLEKGEVIFETVHIRKDGSSVPVEVFARSFELRERMFLLSTSRDITERKKAEEQLLIIAQGVSSQTGAAFFRLLVDSMVKALGVDYAYVGAVSEENERLINIVASYAGGNLPEGHALHSADMLFDGWENRRVRIYPKDVQQVFPESAFLKEMHIESYAGMSLFDSAGQRLGLLAILHRKPLHSAAKVESLLNIFGARAAAELERSKAERERDKLILELQNLVSVISNSQKEWRETFDSITDLILIMNMDFTVTKANRAVERMLGIPLINVLGKKCHELFHNLSASSDVCPGIQCLATRKVSTAEIYEPHLKMFLEITAIPRLGQNNELNGLIHIVRDITEHKTLREQLSHAQKMEAVGQLAGGIAHDFNNMLTVIMSSGQLLEMKLAKESALRTHVGHILDASERGANMVKGLLAFSRKQVFYPVSVNLNQIVKEAEHLIRSIVTADIELRITLTEDVLTVTVDKTQIDQVLINVVANARDAMPSGGMITIGTEFAELHDVYSGLKPGRYALVTVSDTGTGMDEKTRERIFEPFFTTKDVGKGTGLGLSQVYGIIKQHEGSIYVYSTPGIGTTVKIYLPLAILGAAGTETAEVSFPEGGSETILFAEDDVSVRNVTKNLLEEFGYEVIVAVDGEDAVDIFRRDRDKIQLVLIDIIMPKMNGKEAHKKMKEMRANIRTIFMSGYTAEQVSF